MKAPHRLSIDFSPPPSACATIERMWSEGHDSVAIATALGMREPAVCRVLRRQQDDRYDLRQQEAHCAGLSSVRA
ncbi:hypothetical protein [Methylobacterium sp. Leaf108]|uniref:hypothetical protein n=1 Tax=Methylobacterium sp. Leaf108 TaxID=1736256 RepID=UPI0006FD69C1|nr:hypothetical protein [Methylobacterium sp. Leaf108]KQP61079.1 hypothetical protein ASF39_15520 [Methylobacterium sp. Leaf108]